MKKMIYFFFSMDSAKTHQMHPDTDKMKFHPIGLDGSNFITENGWKIKTLKTIRRDLGHSEVIIT